jgi:hypothetical protein
LISTETFLEQLADRRRQAQAEALQLLPAPQDVELPLELVIAAKFGGLVSPVLARSVYAPLSAYIGSLSSDPVQLLQYFAAFPDCNWSLTTGVQAGITVAEFDCDFALESLAYLSGDEDDWRRTLRFETAQASFALFALSAQRIRPRFNRFAGLRVHCGDSILIPPSVVGGRRLEYVDPFARLAATPMRLLSSAHDAR